MVECIINLGSGFTLNIFRWLISNTGFPEEAIWSGTAGIALASILQNITGVGSIFILLVLLLITILLLWERDLQRSIDNIKIWMDSIRDKMESARIAREEKKAQKAAEREKRIIARKAEIELKKEEKAAEKALKETAKAQEKVEKQAVKKIPKSQ